MNIKRFHAPTAREALAKARMAFGDGTLILSNRPTPNGVEVVATAEETLNALDEVESAPVQERPVAKSAPRESGSARAASNPVQQDTEALAMSTLSFQDYVRERMLRRRHEALGEAQTHQTDRAARMPETSPIQRAAAAPMPRHNPLTKAAPQPAARSRHEPPVAMQSPKLSNQDGVMHELQAMKDLIEDRFNTLSWLGQARQNPIQSNLMLKMIRAGYSPALARTILERLPEELGAAESVHWLMEVLERNVKTDASVEPLYEQGGTYALVGSTGVGKTTTTAKLAALCARIHGPASVGLITLDTYRVGAHEQLRSYGRMLGIVAHLAHDQAALQDLLGLLSSKKMVLIDTTGVAPRDPRRRDMLDVLDLPEVQRLLVLNAGSHGDTLEDTLMAFKTSGAQQAILTKVDEAVKLGPAIDALIRHQLLLRGVTNGQRVPEDWEAADAHALVATSMRSLARSAFDPKSTELNFFFSHNAEQPRSRGLIDA
ncbi:MAG: flagellar biosynthesis protein FlhF [Simplicispira suum]|uniref:flagellar biosynthesis protein FlhF n=1 Tax=Simplicispira suum TaxID=2109915 RepID=UPI001C6CBF84|nr:flagellar biosynthesis protein FlhF [Simplicispira suum]MBW7832842.1 flagellar biosynthesis protein FlhF [Simplicispira suum]